MVDGCTVCCCCLLLLCAADWSCQLLFDKNCLLFVVCGLLSLCVGVVCRWWLLAVCCLWSFVVRCCLLLFGAGYCLLFDVVCCVFVVLRYRCCLLAFLFLFFPLCRGVGCLLFVVM